MAGFHAGRPPCNRGLRYPADPRRWRRLSPFMRAAGDRPHGRRLRGLMVPLWRAGLRIQEALALTEGDLDHRRGALVVRRGKGGRRREIGMDAWAWEELQPWLEVRVQLPVGPLSCVINGPTRGRPWSSAAYRAELRRTALAAGVRRRFAPHQLRHAHAVEMEREGVPPIVTQARRQQLRHHLRLPARHRQRRNHPDRPRRPRADHPRQRIAAALTGTGAESPSSRKAGARPAPASRARRANGLLTNSRQRAVTGRHDEPLSDRESPARGPAHALADERQQPAALPELVRPCPGGVRVGVVEPGMQPP
jgi:hypothetical protein